jgi:hypothetical protein
MEHRNNISATTVKHVTAVFTGIFGLIPVSEH